MNHVTVMPREALEYLAVKPDGVYVDATTGLGGHTALIAAQLTSGVVIANDRDEKSLEMARNKTAPWSERIRFHYGAFSDLDRALAAEGFDKIDGVLADLGVSRYQLTAPERGFSFTADGPLDMRLDQASMRTTAADLVNYANEKTLADLIFQLGEERRARRVARAIVRARPIRSTLHLADVVLRAVPRTGHLHPATKTFMALRMEVNDEQREIDRFLQIGPGLLKSGGRMVVISFMSTDDRKVKERFRGLAREGRANILTRKPLTPSEDEVAENPASRSAKLRALEAIQ